MNNIIVFLVSGENSTTEQLCWTSLPAIMTSYQLLILGEMVSIMQQCGTI